MSDGQKKETYKNEDLNGTVCALFKNGKIASKPILKPNIDHKCL